MVMTTYTLILKIMAAVKSHLEVKQILDGHWNL